MNRQDVCDSRVVRASYWAVDAAQRGISMRMKILLTIAAAGFALVTFRATTADVAAQNGAALSGTVSSKEEGKMEGVVVNARRDGGISTVSVVTNKDGRYSFPRTHLEAGA